MNLAGELLQRLDVRPAERRLFTRAFGCLLLLGAGSIALLNATETLFLKRVGVESLPLVLLASSGLLVLTTAGTARIAGSEPGRWLPRMLGLLTLALIPFLPFLGSRSAALMSVLVLVSRQILGVGLLVFWMAMGSLVPARRAKQLFAPLAAGMTLGAILGSFGSGPLADAIGMAGLVLVCTILVGGSCLLSTGLQGAGVRRLEQAPPSRAARLPRMADDVGFGELLRTSPLFRHLGIALLVGGVLAPVLYFEFATLADAASQGPGGEQQLLELYALFRGCLNAALLAAQVGLNALLFRWLGLPLAMALWPAAYLLGFGWLGVDFVLAAGLVGYGASRFIEDGISDSASRVLYNLFPEGVRGRVSGLLEGPVNRIGGVLGNGAVLAAVALGVSAPLLGSLAIPLASLWAVSALVLWRTYPRLLLRASAEHGLAGAGIDRAALVDPTTLRSLSTDLADPDPSVCRAAVDLVVEGEPALAVRALATALVPAPPSHRALLVDRLHLLVEPSAPGSARSDEATRALESALVAKPAFTPEERGDILRTYARLTAGPDVPARVARSSRARLERALGDRDAPVRLAAIAELHRRDAPPPGLPELDRVLDDACDASDARIRRAARRELRAALVGSTPDARWDARLRSLARHLESRADRAETAEALREIARHHGRAMDRIAGEALRFAEDRDPRVRGALLALAGLAGLADAGGRLVAALGSRAQEEAEGAHEGLVALGAEAALPLLVGLELGAGARREALLGVLRELEVDPETLRTLRDRQLEAIRRLFVHRAALEARHDPTTALLHRRLEERVAEGVGALLAVLAALYADKRLSELERRLRRVRRDGDRDLLIEAIEATLDRSERGAVVPLLEPGEWSRAGSEAARALGEPEPETTSAVEALRVDLDPTTRRLARALALDGEDEIGDPSAMPSSMDIAVRLQEMPVFDRLTVPQCLMLAELLQEQKLSPGEQVFAAGEEAHALYLVLEGEIELARGALVLGRAGPGEFFGERGALEGVPRSAAAVARSQARLLRLDREDLLSLLEEAPALTLGFAQRLSARVRQLEDRLEADRATNGSVP